MVAGEQFVTGNGGTQKLAHVFYLSSSLFIAPLRLHASSPLYKLVFVFVKYNYADFTSSAVSLSAIIFGGSYDDILVKNCSFRSR